MGLKWAPLRNLLSSFAFVVVFLSAATSAFCDDQAGASWRDLRPNDKISGRALCALELWMMTQVVVETCNLPKLPVDDAIGRAVVSIQRFVAENWPRPLQPETFDDMRRVIRESVRKAPGTVCGGPDFDKQFRSATSEEVDAGVKTLLASPPAPGENVPCL